MDLKGRQVDAWGNVVFSTDGLIDHLLQGGEIHQLYGTDDSKIQQFNQLCREFDHPEDQVLEYTTPNITVEQFDTENQNCWFIPEPFNNINVYEWLLSRCNSELEISRVNEEWRLFEERGMENVLRFLIYLIDDFRRRNIVWGVGRGSSVSSFCLYLIGVHKINSIEFNLDVSEFLK